MTMSKELAIETMSQYPTCEYEVNSDERIFAIFEEGKGLDDLPKSVFCGRRAFFCQNWWEYRQACAVNFLLEILDPDPSAQWYDGKKWHEGNEDPLVRHQAAIKRLRDHLKGNHWRYLCIWHRLSVTCLTYKLAIEDYIERYLWRHFCWCAPWSQFKAWIKK